MLNPGELAAFKAVMTETGNIDEDRRALAVLQLEAGNPLEMIGVSAKHVQSIRKEFLSIGTGAFKDKRHNNAKVLFTKPQRDEVIAMLNTTTPNDWGYTNSAFWSTRILTTVIKCKYRVAHASRTSYYVVFKKASFTSKQRHFPTSYWISRSK